MPVKKTKNIFDKYADEYDLLTNASVREKHHRKEVKAIIKKFNPSYVLDAGCATGLTAKLFAEQSIPTVGLDRSKSMIKIARQKHSSLSNFLTFRYGNFEQLPKSMQNKFDLIVCLATSISGVDTISNLNKSMRSFYTAIKPGGVIILQLLNFGIFREEDIYPIKVTINDGIIYSRFTERYSNRISVYVNRLDIKQSPPKYEVFRHQFPVFSVAEMTKSLKLAKFSRLKKYSSLYFTKKFTPKSLDLVITGQKKPA